MSLLKACLNVRDKQMIRELALCYSFNIYGKYHHRQGI